MQITKLVVWMLICQIPALVGMGSVRANMDWYHALNLPVFVPPDWLFSAVWAVLYVLLGVVGYLITKEGIRPDTKPLLYLFVAQLFLNACCTPVFFGQQQVFLGLLLVSAMIILAVWLMKKLWQPMRSACWLMLPYTLWLGFAWCLNYAILVLNA